MLLTKLKIMVAVLTVLGMGVFGGELLVHRTAGAIAADEVKQEAIPTKVAQLTQEMAVQTAKLRNTLDGHSNQVWSVAFSPDGKTLASGSYDNTIKLWDVATAKERATFKGHTRIVYSVAFSPDGKTLASASADSIKLWDAATGKEMFSLKGRYPIAYSADGKRLASGSQDDDGTIVLWDVATATRNATLDGHTEGVNSVAFSPDGRTLASAGRKDQTIKLWDVATAKEHATLNGHNAWLKSVTFSPDGKTLASASMDQTIKLWDVATGRERATLKGHTGWKGVLDRTGWVNSVAFSPNGNRLASGGVDETIKVWDVATCRVLVTFWGHTGSVWSVVYSPDGRTVASGSADKTIKLWNIPAAQEIKTTKKRTVQEQQKELRKDSSNGIGGEQGQTQGDGPVQKPGEGPKPKPNKASGIANLLGNFQLESVDFTTQTLTVFRQDTLPFGAKSVNHPKLVILAKPTTKITVYGKESQLVAVDEAKNAALRGQYPFELYVECESETFELTEDGTINGKIKWMRPLVARRIEAKGFRVEGTVVAVNLPEKIFPNVAISEEKKWGSQVQNIYDVAKDADIFVNGKAAKFSDLKPHMKVALQMPSLKELVVSVAAIGAKVEGVVKAVDADKNTVSIHISSFQMTAQGVPVAKDAKVVINGMEGKLSDLKAGARVTLQMSAESEQSSVIGITTGKATER